MNPRVSKTPAKYPAWPTPLAGSSQSNGFGFRYWMDRVFEEAELAKQAFEADPVHDLRVALRRCRSMADGFRSLDPDPGWKAMKRAGGRVFRSLGDLRDVQVMRECTQKLAPPGDALQLQLDRVLAVQEEELKREAQISLGRLDAEQWKEWAEHLSARAARVRVESPAFQYAALERWHEAYGLHRRALRNRSRVAWHSLRVGIKRFRYTVENFLPERHERWAKDLKSLQDALGDVHDLDILWERIRTFGFGDHEAIERWRDRIVEERAGRVEIYRKKMLGPGSLWRVWRSELPEGHEQHGALLARAQTLVSFSGASVIHARHVVKLALQLHDGLVAAGVFGPSLADSRHALELAAMLQDVGRFRTGRGHHKHSHRMLRRMAAPLNWPGENWEMVAGLARYHRGALPEMGHDEYEKVPAGKRKRFLRLAAVLRLANALDAGHARVVRSIKVVRTPETITLLAAGYVEDPAEAPAVAVAKYLLETACGLPVVLRAGSVKPEVVVMSAGKRMDGRTSRAAISKRRAALS